MNPGFAKILLDHLCLALRANCDSDVGGALSKVWCAQRLNKFDVFNLEVLVDVLDEEIGD